MDLSLQKQELINWITEIEDDSVIEELQNVKESHTEKDKGWWDEISEEERKSIERGAKSVEEGRVKPIEEFLKKYD